MEYATFTLLLRRLCVEFYPSFIIMNLTIVQTNQLNIPLTSGNRIHLAELILIKYILSCDKWRRRSFICDHCADTNNKTFCGFSIGTLSEYPNESSTSKYLTIKMPLTKNPFFMSWPRLAIWNHCESVNFPKMKVVYGIEEDNFCCKRRVLISKSPVSF